MSEKRKLTLEEKAQIINLHEQGLTGPEIGEQLHIEDTRQVVGVVRSAINYKKTKPHPSVPRPENPMTVPSTQPQVPELPPQALPTETAPPSTVTVPRPVQAPQPQKYRPKIADAVAMAGGASPAPQFTALPPASHQGAAPAGGEGFGSAWAPVQGFNSGFNFQSPARKYMVYRDEPNHGLLGEHADPFGEKEVAQTYGSGIYRVQRFDPGNPRPYQVTFRVSENYGPPKFAQRGQGDRPSYSRWSQNRPWMRDRTQEEEVEPNYAPRPSAYDFARHAPAQNNDATAAAIKALGDINAKTLDLAEQGRRQGPDSFITKFFGEQQAIQQRQMDENRRQDDQRRRDDEDKWERRQKEAEAEHKRRQEDEEKRHDRELAKIKADAESRSKEAESSRKQLLELEGAKLRVTEEQNRLREDALKDELKRNRDEQKEQQARLEKQLSEMQEATQATLAENQARLEKEQQRDREVLDREHKLKEKGQDKEHELQSKILDIKKEQIEAQGSNELFQIANNLINKISNSWNQMIELKKMEIATPETQVALAQRGHAAAAAEMGDGKKAEPETQQQPAQASAAAGGNGKGSNGHASAAKTEEEQMEEIIQQAMDQPAAQKILKEWARHVKHNQNATTFVNMYMEWMQDPNDHEGRKATTMFANFIAVRDWAEVYGIIKPKLSADLVKIFDTPGAAEYYETFRALVGEGITAYWERFAEEREALKAARRASGRPVAEEASAKK